MKEPREVASSHDQYRHLSLAELQELRRRAPGRSKKRALPLLPQSRDNTLPLSYAQERLWFLDQLGLAGAAYNLLLALRLSGKLAEEALERGFAELLRRHEILRAHFGEQDGVPCQVIEPAQHFELRRINLEHELEAQGRERLLSECMRNERLHRFDLSAGPLMRVTLVRLATDEHALLVSMHHIVSDGWSLGLLARELGALYTAYLQGQSSPLDELPVQYADYAIWQRQRLEGELLREQVSHWQECLAGAPSQLQLPTDRPRPAQESFRGAELKFDLPVELVAALKQLARDTGSTLFMVSLAAFQALLSRWSGQQDIVVGAPIAGRVHHATEALLGCFINTLVLRTDLSGQPTFRQLLERVRHTTLTALAHQDLPFEVLVKELRPERSLTYQPVLQVALALQNYPVQDLDLPGLTTTRIECECVTTHMDLTLYLDEHDGCISAAFEYATDLFDSVTVTRMAGHLRRLLEAVVANPDVEADAVALLGESEQRAVLLDWNETAAPYPNRALIHELFEEQVARAPHATAVTYEEQTLTSAELNRKANQLGRYLREQGTQMGECIPILMPRSLHMVVAQLAILKCGCAYVPIDPQLPLARRTFMIADCGAQRVLTDHHLSAADRQGAMQWIVWEDIARRVADAPDRDLGLGMEAEAAAYVMYTSGSTGVPKGVVVPHRAVNRLAINNGYAKIVPNDCIAHCSNPAFDASTFEIWAALLNGASVLIVPQCVVLDAGRFAELLIRARVSVLWLTIGLLAQYAEALSAVFGRLRYLLTGGDVVDPATIRRVLRNGRPQHLLSAYGPTECTTFSTTYQIEDVSEDATSIPIGRPIANAQIYILDAHSRPVPARVAGEIYIGGAGVALGYLNRPELTAERFIADPFSSQPGARLYRTGDRARWLNDGNIEFLGRDDGQVKLRGLRIELGEIETRLTQHARMREAIVVVREDGGGEKRLVAYFTTDDAGGQEIDELRMYMKAALPDYMVPSAFVALHALPLTPNGKVDRRALPPPDRSSYAMGDREAPLGEVEETLSKIWQELLQVDRIGRDDNFFELGGHSMHGIKLIAAVAQRLAVRVSAIAVFRYPTVRQLAQFIEPLRPESAATVTTPEATDCEQGIV